MRVLLDEMMPRRIIREATGDQYEVVSIGQMGWAGVKNGELLRRAMSSGFGALVTMDRNMEHQQGTARAGIGIVVLIAPSKRPNDLRPLGPLLAAALERVRPGQVIHVEADDQ